MTNNWKANLYLFVKYGSLIFGYIILANLFWLIIGLLPQATIPVVVNTTILVSTCTLIYKICLKKQLSLFMVFLFDVLLVLNARVSIINTLPWQVYIIICSVFITLVIYVLHGYIGFKGNFEIVSQLHNIFSFIIVMQALSGIQTAIKLAFHIYTIMLLCSYIFFLFVSFLVFDVSKKSTKLHLLLIIIAFGFNACFEQLIYNMFWYNLSLGFLLLCVCIIKNKLNTKSAGLVLKMVLILFAIPTPFQALQLIAPYFDKILNLASLFVSITIGVATLFYEMPIKGNAFISQFQTNMYSNEEILSYFNEEIKTGNYHDSNDFKRISIYCKNKKLPYNEDALNELTKEKTKYVIGLSIIGYIFCFLAIVFSFVLFNFSGIRTSFKNTISNCSPEVSSFVDEMEMAFDYSYNRLEYVCTSNVEILKTPRTYFTEVYEQQFEDCFHAGRLKTALHKADLLIKLNKNNASYYDDRVIVLFAMGDYSHALNDIEKALSLEPGNPEYLASKGAALIALNNPDIGIQYLNNALSMQEIGFAYRFRALANMELHSVLFEEVLRDIEHAINLDASQNDYIALARYYIGTNEMEKAYNALQIALDKNPYWGRTYYWLGCYYELIGDYTNGSKNYLLSRQYGYIGYGY